MNLILNSLNNALLITKLITPIFLDLILIFRDKSKLD
jgi:hypothetical protein